MSAYDTLDFRLVGDASHQAYVRPGKSGRAIVFIAGFGQPAESWFEVVRECRQNYTHDHHNHTLAVIVRRHEEFEPPRLLGWQSIGRQQREVLETLLQLKRNELSGLRLVLVGHSLGAMLARYCLGHRQISAVTDKLVQICPSPLTWWDFTFHAKFWWKGGLISVPNIVLALLGLTRGFFPTMRVARQLFTGEIYKERFEQYYWSLVRDSALVFLQVCFSHNELQQWKHTRRQWSHGHNVIVGSRDDPVISEHSIMRLIRDDTTNDDLHWFSPGTPHCFWMASDMDLVRNLVLLRAIIVP